jgi:sugar phosphate isomerase/epimerase
VRDLGEHPEFCAVNTATLGFQAPIGDTIEAIARAGFGGVAPWRREVEGGDVKAVAKRIRDAKLKVTGYCRSTFIPANDRAGFEANIEANRRAISDAALLGAGSFVMVVGGLAPGSKDIAAARAQVADGIGLLLEHARPLGVTLALEPLHPVYAADRSCLALLSEGLDLCDKFDDPLLGVCIDVYHVWWDPNLARDIGRAGKRIAGFHVCDWLLHGKDVLNDRGMMGDGVIDISGIRRQAEAAGYAGLVEAEIFSAADWWKRPMAETLAVAKQRFAEAT